MYVSDTCYPGFTTGRVMEAKDSVGEYVWIDNGDTWTVIWTDGIESVWMRDEPK